uniref:Uncharacterized protein n=1 Tax=viral metagenome TaxID=1070528 RepID=A0A6M3KM44_9ZZZZ
MSEAQRVCPVHGLPFKRFEKDGKVWYAHKQGDTWCNEDKLPKDVKQEKPPEVVQTYSDNKNLSYALSYAKDLCVAGKIELKDILPVASYFGRFLGGCLKFSDQQVSDAMKLSPQKYKEVTIPAEQVKVAQKSTTVPNSAGELYNWMSKHLTSKKVTPHEHAIACGVVEGQLKDDLPGAYRMIKVQHQDWAEYPN